MANKKKTRAQSDTKPDRFIVQASVDGIVLADVVFKDDGVTIADVFHTCVVEQIRAIDRDAAAFCVVKRNPHLAYPRDFERVYLALWRSR